MLHLDSQGQGQDLVMLHGWGMHSGIWTDWARCLSHDFRVHLLDLPGHGNSADPGVHSLDEWAEAAVKTVPANAWWLGWSLGGLVSMNAARLFADRVRGLVLLSSTPKFVKADDWLCAVDPEVFVQFRRQLEHDTERTLTRFLALQVRGGDNSGESLRQLRSQLKTRPQARLRALGNGLRLLQDSDMRSAVRGTRMPVHWLLGGRDTLVPAALVGQLKGSFALVEGAGHAPFLSHPQQCSQQVINWLRSDAEGVGYAGL